MSWADALTMAAREIRRRPARTALTVLAVTLAGALLTALLAIAGTAKSRVLSQISHGGSVAGITVVPAAVDPAQASLDDPVPGPPLPLTAAAIARMRALPDVASVLPVVTAPVEVLPPLTLPAHSTDTASPILSTSIVGASLSSGAIPVTLLAGRLPVAGSPYEVAVGESYLGDMGIGVTQAQEVVGTRLGLVETAAAGGFGATRLVTAEVVGVVDEQLAGGDLVAWPQLVDTLYASASSSTGAPAAAGAPLPPVAGVVVIASQLADVPAVRAAIATIGFSSAAPVGLIISVGRYLHVVEIVLSGIGIVALLIAALGIANALFAAVRERRWEIGVLKAIGARDRDVLRLFLLEAGALGIIGGFVGTLLGIVMAAAIAADANSYLHAQGLAGVALSVPSILPLACVAGSGVVALAAGALPARRAARLPPRGAVDA